MFLMLMIKFFIGSFLCVFDTREGRPSSPWPVYITVYSVYHFCTPALHSIIFLFIFYFIFYFILYILFLYFELLHYFKSYVLDFPFTYMIFFVHICEHCWREPEIEEFHCQQLLPCTCCAHDNKDLESWILIKSCVFSLQWNYKSWCWWTQSTGT